ncbi:hypothetical protein ALC57_08629 [Trachymyrmex cornetzi]|uniref:Uncharacterized protein n=1 Tax=Trachymyrmex cornetzi TaxID=471704 RepID=A0A195E1I0_9HYME|nr:hypothetical protein ALC57_08629 [Trachymyrmex cornetzi]
MITRNIIQTVKTCRRKCDRARDRVILLPQEVVISATRITRFRHNPIFPHSKLPRRFVTSANEDTEDARATFPRNYLRSWPAVTVKLPTA